MEGNKTWLVTFRPHIHKYIPHPNTKTLKYENVQSDTHPHRREIILTFLNGKELRK